MSELFFLRNMLQNLYKDYSIGLINLEAYIRQARPIDKQIDQLELKTISCYLVDSPVLQRSFLKHLR